MNNSFDARPQRTGGEDPTPPDGHAHTEATALAGIANKGRETASRGNKSETAARTGRAPSVSTAGRILAGATMVGVLGALTLAGGAAGAQQSAANSPLAVANGVHAYGRAIDHGPDAAQRFNRPVVGIAATRSGAGYWLTAADGGVFAFGDAHFDGSTGGIKLAQPVVGIAAGPRDGGYWLAARDGGVFTFGAARFHGSAAGLSRAPIVAIASTPSGSGYWLAAADGGVFAFGDAAFEGNALRFALHAPIVGIAATNSGDGYWLVASDGGVFAFGDARFRGSAVDGAQGDAVGISATGTGNGYLVARASGSVVSFHSKEQSTGDLLLAGAAPTVAIAARANGGYWTAQGAPTVDHLDPFLVCTRRHESSPNGPNYDDGYGAIDPSGTYRGAYQFDQSTWDNTAKYTGRIDLIGVDPSHAAVTDQDFLALSLYRWRGASPWLNRCAGLA